jgi:monothiol glutaredoxin
MNLTPEQRQKLEQMISSDDVVLFMKGTRSFPQCGFSASVVNILNTLIPRYTTVNVLSDPDVRNGLKELSNWPTFPQLYVRGELVGGSDIIRQLHESGELSKVLGDLAKPAAPAAPPSVTVTAKAAEVLRGALADAGAGDVVHLSVDGRWEHSLDLGPPEAGSLSVQSNGVTVQVAPAATARLAGVVIDFVDGPQGSGFKIENPNRPPQVVQLAPKELQALLAEGKITELYDVRTPKERATASIEGARLLDDAAAAHIETLDKSTPIAFHCHHGGRSQNAAEHFLQKGFRKVYNLAGGIDAWSRDVDSKVPRY